MDIDRDTRSRLGSSAFHRPHHGVTSTTPRRGVSLLLLVAVLVGLPACGAGAPAAGEPTVTRLSSTSTAAIPPAGEATSPAEIAGAVSAYVTLPQSRTPDGYFMLGEPDAPILIQHYSDFL